MLKVKFSSFRIEVRGFPFQCRSRQTLKSLYKSRRIMQIHSNSGNHVKKPQCALVQKVLGWYKILTHRFLILWIPLVLLRKGRRDRKTQVIRVLSAYHLDELTVEPQCTGELIEAPILRYIEPYWSCHITEPLSQFDEQSGAMDIKTPMLMSWTFSHPQRHKTALPKVFSTTDRPLRRKLTSWPRHTPSIDLVHASTKYFKIRKSGHQDIKDCIFRDRHDIILPTRATLMHCSLYEREV